MEVRSNQSAFRWAVILQIPSDDARFVMVQFVKPAADYAETGNCEFIPDSTRPVLCEPNTTAGKHYGHWLWEGPEDQWVPAIVVHQIVSAYGEQWIVQKGRFEFVSETGGYAPTDCYLTGVE